MQKRLFCSAVRGIGRAKSGWENEARGRKRKAEGKESVCEELSPGDVAVGGAAAVGAAAHSARGI